MFSSEVFSFASFLFIYFRLGSWLRSIHDFILVGDVCQVLLFCKISIYQILASSDLLNIGAEASAAEMQW